MTDGKALGFRRANHGFLAGIEAPVLVWLAARMPRWLTPNGLTGIGFLGATVVLAGYALSPHDPHFLWLATVGLILNWFGDSLDGSLARYRQIERPRYGFYLDNSIDIVEQLMLVIGLVLSGILRIELALLGLLVFYAMSILTLIRAHVFGEFSIDYGGLGPTELRVVFIILNIAVLIAPPQEFGVLGIAMTYPNVLSVIWITFTAVTFVLVMMSDLRKLAVEEPPRNDRSS